MKVVKAKGRAQRTKKMHGSAAEWRLQELNQRENARTEKPGNLFGGGNRNRRARGSARPRRQQP